MLQLLLLALDKKRDTLVVHLLLSQYACQTIACCLSFFACSIAVKKLACFTMFHVEHHHDL